MRSLGWRDPSQIGNPRRGRWSVTGRVSQKTFSFNEVLTPSNRKRYPTVSRFLRFFLFSPSPIPRVAATGIYPNLASVSNRSIAKDFSKTRRSWLRPPIRLISDSNEIPVFHLHYGYRLWIPGGRRRRGTRARQRKRRDRERGRREARGEGKGIRGESSRRGVYLYSESCGMPRKWNNQWHEGTRNTLLSRFSPCFPLCFFLFPTVSLCHPSLLLPPLWKPSPLVVAVMNNPQIHGETASWRG